MRTRPPVMIMLNLLLFLVVSGAAYPAFAGLVEIQAIQIVPSEARVGKHPEITASIKTTRELARDETLTITVIAVVVRPDHVMKSWTWKNIRMRTGDVRTFTIPKEYEMNLAGTYKVDFNVYTRKMLPLYRLSSKFVAVAPSRSPAKKTAPADTGAGAKATPVRTDGGPAGYRSIGIGLSANTMHRSGGATMLLWPFKHAGLQASYTVGSFSIAEGRVLARFPLSSGITPYLGVGYLNVTTTRAVETIGVRTSFQDSGVSGAIGVEIPLGRRLFGTFEVSGSSIDLKKEVAGGGITGTASVKFAPATIGISVVYYLF